MARDARLDWNPKNEEPGKWILNPDNPRKVTVWIDCISSILS